ncbi:MAG: hypothetical protein AVDCRST_MAG76-3261 [uncultured Acidimicrobiales bacterium]|uniref:Uncharacterized protein n=1 Tax=uncultured Acidimicrobiales bacterium TaxID=310071 RepID=A0A6J4J5Z9_9ACTN|nr:MAG: hypothetical protein AVDCRST_MAG76-3261 [uncultured Acidimicrobiales bacterium]
MSSYQAPPPSAIYGQSRPTEAPPAIKTSVAIVWAVVALSVISTILTFFLLDEIVESAGVELDSTEEDAARIGGIVGAIIGFLIFGALWILLGTFLRKGANWARIVLTVLAGLGLLFGLFGLTRDQPGPFRILGVVQLVLMVALLVFMWRRESSDYIDARQAG